MVGLMPTLTKTLLNNVLHAEGEFNEFGKLFGIVE
jgi:hypothetical protein